MSIFLIILFNSLILTTWIYLLYQVYTVDKDIQSELVHTNPGWKIGYNGMILSVKITAFINGILVLLTILSSIYNSYTAPVVGGRRR